jgi:hypothetical protein
MLARVRRVCVRTSLVLPSRMTRPGVDCLLRPMPLEPFPRGLFAEAVRPENVEGSSSNGPDPICVIHMCPHACDNVVYALPLHPAPGQIQGGSAARAGSRLPTPGSGPESHAEGAQLAAGTPSRRRSRALARYHRCSRANNPLGRPGNQPPHSGRSSTRRAAPHVGETVIHFAGDAYIARGEGGSSRSRLGAGAEARAGFVRVGRLRRVRAVRLPRPGDCGTAPHRFGVGRGNASAPGLTCLAQRRALRSVPWTRRGCARRGWFRARTSAGAVP